MTADFVNGKFAMMSDGTGTPPPSSRPAGRKLDFGYFPLPASDNAADNKFLGGKVELTLAIPSNAKNKAAAIEYLDFFTKNYQLFDDQAGFAPSVTGAKSNAFYDEIAEVHQHVPARLGHDLDPQHQGWPGGVRTRSTGPASQPMGKSDAQGRRCRPEGLAGGSEVARGGPAWRRPR